MSWEDRILLAITAFTAGSSWVHVVLSHLNRP